MSVSVVYLRHHGPVLRSLAGTLLRSKLRPKRSNTGQWACMAPGPLVTAVLPPRPASLLTAYACVVGGQTSACAGLVPPHFFPQWGMPLLSAAMAHVPLDLTRLLNGSCTLEQRAPLPAGVELHCEAQLIELDHTQERTLITQRLITGTADTPTALIVHVTGFLPGPGRKKGKKKTRPHVPTDGRELTRWQLPASAGRDFALLTGDINPIHWAAPMARLAGFKGVLLHGFGIMARVWESLVGHPGLCADMGPASLELRFVRPLVLPADVGLYVGEHTELFVGAGPGQACVSVGTFAPAA